ncbi:MAG: triose-phosphate isomerase [Anaerolineae bacterium]|nr:triose-phosphate isomerase [Anaerolineae bacterium]
MSRIPIVAGNWKMYKTPSEAVDFVTSLIPELSPLDGVERVICPPFLAIPGVSAKVAGSPIQVGAQNVHWQKEGAFTSDIAPAMLKGLVEYVIVGHSEVRQYHGDTDERVNMRAKAALEAGLKPIIAVGESVDTYRAGQTETFVGAQIRACFAGIPQEAVSSIVVAYEPLWAIGTGLTPTAEEANQIIKNAIRNVLASLYGEDAAQQVRIQYGGSVKPDNMKGFMSQPDIDGALVGGASLKVNDFVTLVKLAREAKGLA